MKKFTHVKLNRIHYLVYISFGSLISLLLIIVGFDQAKAETIPLQGVGAMDIIYNPHNHYIYTLNSNDSVSVIDSTDIIATIDLPTGGFSHLTDFDVAQNGDVYISQWFFDQVVIIRDLEIFDIIERDQVNQPGIENGPVVVVAHPLSDRIYVATGWTDEIETNGVTIVNGTNIITHVPTGAYPQAMAVSTNTGYLYVANAEDDTVSVIDGESVIVNIPVGMFPLALGIDPIHGLVYVVNRDSGTVTLINDLATPTFNTTVAVGVNPIAIYVAYDAQNSKAYVANKGSFKNGRYMSSVSIIDGTHPKNPAVTRAVGENPLAIIGDPNSGLIYVASQGEDRINVISNSTVLTIPDVIKDPVAMTFNEQDSMLYVSSYQDASVYRIHGTTVITPIIKGLPRLSHASIEKRGDQTVIADLTGQKTWFLNDKNEIMDSISTPDMTFLFPEAPTHDRFYDYLQVTHESLAIYGQNRVFISNHHDNSVSALTGTGSPLAMDIGVDGQPYDIESMPGRGLYVAKGNGIAILPEGDLENPILLSGPEFNGARAFAAWPDENRMYVARSPGGASHQITVLDTTPTLTPTVQKTINICDVPAAMDININQELVYVSCSGSNSVGVISDMTWLGEVPVGAFPQDLIVHSQTGLAYVAAIFSNHIAVLDGTNLLETISVPDAPIALAEDEMGRVLVASELGNTISIISGTELISTIPVATFPNEVASNNGYIYVSSAHEALVEVFRLDTEEEDIDDNDWISATSIISSVAYLRTIENEGDIDWYKINLGDIGSKITVTLGGMAADYDLAIFNPLTVTIGDNTSIGTLDINQVGSNGQIQGLNGSVDLGLLQALPYFGGGMALSNNNFLQPEVLSDQIWESGDYYIAVWGHNGVYDEQPYTLRAEVSLPQQPLIPAAPIPLTYTPPPTVDESVRTLIVTNADRLQRTETAGGYGIKRTMALTTQLELLAQEVSGTIIYLDNIPDVAAAYDQWDLIQNEPNPIAANIVADTVKFVLEDLIEHTYPNIEYIVMVGNDNIVPFYRVPDSTLISNERLYNAGVLDDSPMDGRLQGGYILSDNFYASFHPIPGQQGDLYIPEYAIGRLVETPEEMIATITAFLGTVDPVSVNTALVTGYDFVKDGAESISNTIGSQTGVSVTPLIADGWNADDLRPLLLFGNNQDFMSLNGHFNHQTMLAGDDETSISYVEFLTATQNYTNNLIISIGCQAGLSVPDHEAEINGHDFAQSIVGEGAAFIGNTGYGYGDSDAVGFSETLALKFTRELASNDPVPIGQALMRAKQLYYADSAYGSFGDYDEKVLIEWTLYGLPMMKVQVAPQLFAQPEDQASLDSDLLSKFEVNPSSFTAVPLTITSSFILHSSPRNNGEYYEVQSAAQISNNSINSDDDLQVSPGRPIQPRSSVDLQLPALVAHGVLFLGGEYTDINNFDPVVSRIVSDTALSEPIFPFIDRWYPVPNYLLNRLQLGNSFASERLVAIPAQYQAKTNSTGTERLYSEMNFEVLYTPIAASNDFRPPTIQQVKVITTSSSEISFAVKVVDSSSVESVYATYDDGQGIWHTLPLEFDTQSLEWQGGGSLSVARVFIQAIDTYGNVAVSANKGIYFSAVAVDLSPNHNGLADPGETVAYTHIITNGGSGIDTFSISSDSFLNWPTQHEPGNVTLLPGQSQNLVVSVTIPIQALSGVSDVVTVIATSLSNQAVSSTVVDITNVSYRQYMPLVIISDQSKLEFTLTGKLSPTHKSIRER